MYSCQRWLTSLPKEKEFPFVSIPVSYYKWKRWKDERSHYFWTIFLCHAEGKEQKHFLFLFSEGKEMKPCFPIQTLISSTVVNMTLFETEIIESSKRSALPKPRVWACGQGVASHLKEIQCLYRGRWHQGGERCIALIVLEAMKVESAGFGKLCSFNSFLRSDPL